MRYFGFHGAFALVLAGYVSAESAVALPRASQPERVLRAATRRSDLHRRSMRIERKFESEVVYIEEENGRDGKKTFASQVKVGSMKPILNLEEIEHHLQNVQCSDGTMKLHFTDAATARDARAACHGGHGGMGGLIITSHEGCNKEGERSVYKIDDTTFTMDGEALEIAVTESLWQDAFDSFDITFGDTTSDHLYRRHANFQKRQDGYGIDIPSDTADDVKSVTFDLTSESLDTTFEAADFKSGLENFVDVPDLPVEIGCKNCSTRGQVVLSQGAIKVDAKKIDSVSDGFSIDNIITGGYMELAAKGMGAHLDMFTRTAQSGSYKVSLFPLPILGFVIPGIGKAGAAFEPIIMVDFNISKPLEVTYGVDLMIPDDASIKVELPNIAETTITGVPGAQLNALPFKTNVSDADILLSLAFMPSIPIGFVFSDKMSALITVSMNLPRLDAKMTTNADAAQCDLLGGTPPTNNTDTGYNTPPPTNNTDTTHDAPPPTNTDTTYNTPPPKDTDTTYDGGDKGENSYNNGGGYNNDGYNNDGGYKNEGGYNTDGGYKKEDGYKNEGSSYNNDNSYNTGNSYDAGNSYGKRSEVPASNTLVLVEANVSLTVDVEFSIEFPFLPAPLNAAGSTAEIYSTQMPLMTSCVAPHDGSVAITSIVPPPPAATPPPSTESVCSASAGTCDCAATVTVYLPPTGGAAPPGQPPMTTGNVEQPPSPPATGYPDQPNSPPTRTGGVEQPPATGYPEQPNNPPATDGAGQPPATGYPDQPNNPPATENPEQPPATGYPGQPPATENPEQPPATGYPDQPNNPPATEYPGGSPPPTSVGEQPPATTVAMTPYYPDAPPVETPATEPPKDQSPPVSSTSCVSDSTIRVTLLPGNPPKTTDAPAEPTPPTVSDTPAQPPPYGESPPPYGGESSIVCTSCSTMGTVVKSTGIILTETPTTSVTEPPATATPTEPTKVIESKGFMNTSSPTSPPAKTTTPPVFTGAAAPGADLPVFSMSQLGWQAGVLGLSVMFGTMML